MAGTRPFHKRAARDGATGLAVRLIRPLTGRLRLATIPLFNRTTPGLCYNNYQTAAREGNTFFLCRRFKI